MKETFPPSNSTIDELVEKGIVKEKLILCLIFLAVGLVVGYGIGERDEAPYRVWLDHGSIRVLQKSGSGRLYDFGQTGIGNGEYELTGHSGKGSPSFRRLAPDEI